MLLQSSLNEQEGAQGEGLEREETAQGVAVVDVDGRGGVGEMGTRRNKCTLQDHFVKVTAGTATSAKRETEATSLGEEGWNDKAEP
uniref:Uncharacterized protein n=1 Tax=Knipowitschia caucasica TaxID=637954 RepID=A0AAV2MAJ5_KNICA